MHASASLSFGSEQAVPVVEDTGTTGGSSGGGGAILHDVNKHQPTVVLFKVLTAVEMVVLIFWVVARVDLQIDIRVSEKYIASIFRKVCSSETLLYACMSTQRYNLE